MDHQEFVARFEDWQVMSEEGYQVYFQDIWKDIGSIPLDKKLNILAEIYLLSDPEQRELIVDYHRKETQFMELVFFYSPHCYINYHKR
jgi:hypothetical protein